MPSEEGSTDENVVVRETVKQEVPIDVYQKDVNNALLDLIE